jgi:hypothetical protein
MNDSLELNRCIELLTAEESLSYAALLKVMVPNTNSDACVFCAAVV